MSSPTPSDPDLPRRRSEEAAPPAAREPAAPTDEPAGEAAAEMGGIPLNSGDDAASNREARRKEAAEDRLLIEAAQGGDRGAFRSLVERHQRRAFSIAFGLLRDENDARDIVQEAFLRVYRGLDTFEGSSSFFTWLYRIVTNLSIDLIRKPGRKAAAFDETRAGGDSADEERTSMPMMARVDGADPVDVMRRKEIAGRIQAALEALPPYHRDVILLREIEGLSYEEMAEAMGVSKGTIMSRLFHARQKLQRALADCYDEQLASSSGAHSNSLAGPDGRGSNATRKAAPREGEGT